MTGTERANRELEQLVWAEHSRIAEVLGLCPSQLGEPDMASLVRVLAQPSGSGASVDPVEALRQWPSETRAMAILQCAESRHCAPGWSPASASVRQALDRYRGVLRHREEFAGLGATMDAIVADCQRLVEVVEHTGPEGLYEHDGPAAGICERLVSQLRSADYQAGAGLMWAAQIGICLEEAIAGIERVYLAPMQRLYATFRAMVRDDGEACAFSRVCQRIAVFFQRWRSQFGALLSRELVPG